MVAWREISYCSLFDFQVFGKRYARLSWVLASSALSSTEPDKVSMLFN